jgi:hypothetical protein
MGVNLSFREPKFREPNFIPFGARWLIGSLDASADHRTDSANMLAGDLMSELQWKAVS